MMYFLLIPLLLLLIVAVIILRRSGTKPTAIGRSRLDEARDQEGL